MLREDGAIAIVDFGIAKSLDSSNVPTFEGEALGTPHCTSPEQINGKPLDARMA